MAIATIIILDGAIAMIVREAGSRGSFQHCFNKDSHLY